MEPRAPRRSRRGQRALTVGGTALLVAAIIGVIGHYRPPHWAPVLGVTAFSPYLLLCAPLALSSLALARRWVGTALAAGACVVWVVTQAPLFIATDPPAHALHLTVMQANLRLGEASPEAVVAAVKRYHVDVLMLEELTPGERWKLHDAGLAHELPWSVSDLRGGAQGTGMWSRYPLYDTDQRKDFTFGFVTARISVPHFPCDPVAAALHMAGPWPDSTQWNHDIAHLPSVMRQLAAQPCDMLIGGDFNATPDTAQFRRLLTGGLSDAAEQAGAGLTATYPNDTWAGPLIAIDHVLVRGGVATSVSTLSISGTDHRAVVARVALAVRCTPSAPGRPCDRSLGSGPWR